jgi:hypothetical protein
VGHLQPVAEGSEEALALVARDARLLSVMPVSVVHTPEDEEAWERSKDIAANEYPEATGSNYWRIVMGIYKKITTTYQKPSTVSMIPLTE